MKPFGVDLSRYDSPINWERFWEHTWNVEFIAHRATISYSYVDPYFINNSAEIEIPLLPYHVLYPGESISRQVSNFLSATSGVNWYNAHPVLDVELDHRYTKTKITDALIGFLDECGSALGKRPIIYSRGTWIDEHTDVGTWRESELWWLANYLTDRTEHPGPPRLPAGVTQYLIHQTTDRFPVPSGILGRPYVDADRWDGLGGAVTVRNFFNRTVDLQTWVREITTWAREQGYTGPSYSE